MISKKEFEKEVECILAESVLWGLFFVVTAQNIIIVVAMIVNKTGEYKLLYWLIPFIFFVLSSYYTVNYIQELIK